MLRVLGVLIACALLGACDRQPANDPQVTKPAPAPLKFRYVTHQLGTSEHVTVVDIPDLLAPALYDRCVVFENDKTGAVRMQCDFGGSVSSTTSEE